MSNIDFSQVISAADTQARQAADHAAAVKETCTQRILAQFPFAAQHNIALALAVQSRDALSASDWADARTAQCWITDMRAACRDMAADVTADPQAKDAWPALPAQAKRFIARF